MLKSFLSTTIKHEFRTRNSNLLTPPTNLYANVLIPPPSKNFVYTKVLCHIPGFTLSVEQLSFPSLISCTSILFRLANWITTVKSDMKRRSHHRSENKTKCISCLLLTPPSTPSWSECSGLVQTRQCNAAVVLWHPSVGKVKLCARMRFYVLCTSTEVCTVKWEGDQQVTINPRATLLKLELFDFPLRHRFVYSPVPFFSLLIKTISSLKAFMRHQLIISWLILFIKDVPLNILGVFNKQSRV